MNRYWQAATVVRRILPLRKYRKQLPSFLAGAQPSDWDEFTHDWLTFCRNTYR